MVVFTGSGQLLNETFHNKDSLNKKQLNWYLRAQSEQ